MVSSSYNLMTLSLERYMLNVHPLFQRNFFQGQRLSCWKALRFLVPTLGYDGDIRFNILEEDVPCGDINSTFVERWNTSL